MDTDVLVEVEVLEVEVDSEVDVELLVDEVEVVKAAA